MKFLIILNILLLKNSVSLQQNNLSQLKQANLVRKTSFDNKLISFNRKSKSNQIKRSIKKSNKIKQSNSKRLNIFFLVNFFGGNDGF